jgi:hypothetical protein
MIKMGKTKKKDLMIDAVLDVVVRDKDGNIVKTIHKRCESYVRQFLDLLNVQMSTVTQTINDTGTPTAQSIAIVSGNFNVKGAAASVLYGPVVGTNNTGVTISDTKLGTLILHGNTANKLMYGLTGIGVVSVAGSTASFVISRTLTNSSPTNPISVKEVGLYCTGGSTYYFMIDRTLAAFDIANGGATATVTYTISVTV